LEKKNKYGVKYVVESQPINIQKRLVDSYNVSYGVCSLKKFLTKKEAMSYIRTLKRRDVDDEVVYLTINYRG